jgi:hypothetical protein
MTIKIRRFLAALPGGYFSHRENLEKSRFDNTLLPATWPCTKAHFGVQGRSDSSRFERPSKAHPHGRTRPQNRS